MKHVDINIGDVVSGLSIVGAYKVCGRVVNIADYYVEVSDGSVYRNYRITYDNIRTVNGKEVKKS